MLCHTSDEHPWFAESLTEAPKPTGTSGPTPKADGTAPNNWLSAFGGRLGPISPARRQYYHHKFLRQQPKLNWRNPAAKTAALAVLDFWLKRGVDGFRLDVANAYLHDPALTRQSAGADGRTHAGDLGARRQPAVVTITTATCRKISGARRKSGARSSVTRTASCWENSQKARALGPSPRRIRAAFRLQHFSCCSPTRFRRISSKTITRCWREHPRHWPSVAFCNHDVIRTVTRFGGGTERRSGLAKLMLALLLSLKGTVLLYQGEELGLPEADLRRDQLKDPVGDLYYPLHKGRDGCRTPMPWDADSANLGFSTGTPWLPLAPAHRALAVSEQEGEAHSALNLRAFSRYAQAASGLALG